MAAYVIVDVEITDKERYAEYVGVVSATVTRYGGKFLVRGGKTEKLEGSRDPKRIVVLEFPSFERALEWWNSEEYRGPKALRRAASTASILLAEGL